MGNFDRTSWFYTIFKMVLVALSFYATGSYQKLVGGTYGTLMSQQSVSRTIRDVTAALNHPIVLSKWIKFPQTRQERDAIKRRFYEKFHIPSVIGCIDGTHVAIIRPIENEERFFNRKHFHSRNVLIEVTTWLSLLLAVITLGTPASSSEPRVVCYYTNWSVYRPGTARFNPQNINPYLCTHLVYAFGGFTKDNSFKPFDKYQDIEKGGYAKFTGLKTYNKNLKTMLAIGGWNEGSTRFSPMVGSRERRKEFVRNAIKFLRQNRFDGLDLDWEYPAFRDGGKPKDRENYAKLVKELREEFDREAQKTGKPRLLLTMAVPAGIEYIQKGFDVKTLNKYLDWMNLLSYDYHSAFEPAVNHHAPLYPIEEPNEYSVDNELNIDYTIKFYLENGADPDKLVLGIPTYGRSYTLFNPDAVEIGSPADGPGEQGDATREKGYLAYYEICEALKPKSKKRQASDEDSEEYSEEEEDETWTVMHPNAEAMGPVAYKGNQWVGYDDEDIVRKKAAYVADNRLGGIMFWSIDNDDFRGTCHGKPYPLIEAAKEAYFAKLGSTDNAITEKTAVARPSRRKSKPRSSSTTTTTTPKPKSNKRNKPSSSATSTTPAWNIITPEPPTTPDPGSDFKCTDEGFYQHPRDCKKYFWCLDSGPSNLGIVAHQFTCPSGLYFNKAADSCDFARNVPCKKSEPTTKAPTTKPPTTKAVPTSTTTTTTRRPLRLSTKDSSLFRTTSSTTPEPESEEEYEEDAADISDEDAEDPRVIKELIDLIRKVGGIEQLEKQLGFGDSQANQASTDGAPTTTPTAFSKKLYQKVLERTRGRNKYTGVNSILEGSGQYSRRGPQNAGLEATSDKDKLLKKDRPQYTTINRQRGSTSTTEATADSEEIEDASEEVIEQVLRSKAVETEARVGTTAKPLQYVNIRRARPTTLSTSDTADDTASRNALFERSEPLVSVSDSPITLDISSARRENVPEYVTIRRQRPTTEETTTVQYQNSEEEEELQETALEREISTQPQYTSIVRSRSTLRPTEEPSSETPLPRIRSTTIPTEETSSPDPTTVLAVQISSLLNSPNSAEIEIPETESPATTTVAETTTTTTTTTTVAPSSTRRQLIRRRGSTTPSPLSTAAPSSITQAPKRSFLRRTKATAPPDTAETESSTDKSETTTNKFTRRGSSKFKSRKEAELEKKGSTTKNEVENASRRPSLNGGARRSERPTRKFVRVRPGGANATSTTAASIPSPSSSSPSPSSPITRRPFRVTSRRRVVSSTTTSTAAPTTAAAQAATSAYEDEESLQDIGDIDVIEDPTLEPKAPKTYNKVQRRPLVNLKEDVKDQNPSATNEEERKRQSKKYSSTIKQNQLDDLIKSRSQEETTTEAKSTADEINSETALAIAAHQLITAPLPSVQDFEDDVKPTRKTQTTVEYKYTSREYNEQTDSRTPTYDEYQSTPIYKSTLGSYDKTQSDFDSTKGTANFDVLKSPVTAPGVYSSDYPETSPVQTYTSEFDAPKISTATYDIPKTTGFPNTVNTANTANLDFIRTTSDYRAPEYIPKSTSLPNTGTGQDFVRTTLSEFYDTRSEFDSKISSYLPKSTLTNFPTNTAPQEFGRTTGNTYPDTSTDYVAKSSPTYVPKFPSTDYPNTINQEYIRTTLNTFDATPTELNTARISTTLAPPSSTPRYFERTTFSDTPTENSPRIATGFSPRSTATTKFSRNGSRYSGSTNTDGSGYTGVQRGSTQRYRTEKLIPVPVENTGFTTVGYSSSSQEPSYFTREYLLESPVTKTYDEEYQYLSPITTPQTPSTPTRRVIRKKIHRKISTTLPPTTPPPTTQPPATTPKSRRGPPKQPFDKIPKVPKKTYRPIANYDYYDDSDEKVAVKYVEGTKVVMRGDGRIDCLDIGNFPHPTSCKKFISCARIDNGSLLGWEYVCPKGLSFDPVGGICNWSAGLGCDE